MKGVEHVLTELIFTRGKKKDSIFVLNVYSRPHKTVGFQRLFTKVAAIAGGRTWLTLGDFNAAHTAWGYTRVDNQGRKLYQVIEAEQFTILTDPGQPTRRGNVRQRDTTPDLAFLKHGGPATWRNTQTDLGSDHYIIEIKITGHMLPKQYNKTQRITDWHAFRAARKERELVIGNLQEWCATLQQDASRATKTVQTEENECVDSHLLHMWEARDSLKRRLTRSKHNRALRRKVIELQRTIEKSLFKQAVGLPKSASNQRLLEMGLHNTIRELAEATRTAQESRLTQTRAGVETLRRIGYHCESTGHEARVPESFRNLLHFIPLPRHMGGGSEGRRTHRVRALQQAWNNKPNVWYVDASPYPQERAHVIVAIAPNEGATVTASVRTPNTREAEECAIALAINEIGRSGKDGAIISDSQDAIRRLERGTVANTALRLLTSSPTKGKIAIRWTPAHAGLEGNERADSLARELTAQADTTQAPLSPTPLTGYRDILSHYRSDRARYPEPHKTLTRHQAVIIRQVQANALPNPHILSKIHPNLYQPSCRSPSKDTQLAIVKLAEREVQPRTWILQDPGGTLPNTT
ncbi:hypothetical protein HPB47_003455 [Ixodes persulcatus]|uniref:Uncharacterized protein n=2 Tax=Ixodes persulcatus TaxID=34615 RepID=A0AC60PIG9_IXOPE|nr:hypothetical protein HPB47_003455 [Ixodes persulcatus]